MNSFIIVNTSDEKYWQSIFSNLIREQQTEIGGRADIPDELRDDLELLARGDLTAVEIQDVCEKIVRFPDALSCLARLLQDAKVNVFSDS